MGDRSFSVSGSGYVRQMPRRLPPGRPAWKGRRPSQRRAVGRPNCVHATKQLRLEHGRSACTCGGRPELHAAALLRAMAVSISQLCKLTQNAEYDQTSLAWDSKPYEQGQAAQPPQRLLPGLPLQTRPQLTAAAEASSVGNHGALHAGSLCADTVLALCGA